MIWIIIFIIIIVFVVRNNKKKKAAQNDTTTATTKPATGSASSDDFARAMDSLSGTGSGKAASGSGSSSGTPSAADFARVLDSLGGTDGTSTGSGSGSSSGTTAENELTDAVLAYYRSMWNRETGSLYTELDTMQIQHFGIQVKEDGLVDSVWLKGDTIPLVNEISFAKLLDRDNAPRLTQSQRAALLERIKQSLVELGTVEVRGDDLYPIRPGAGSSGQTGSSTGGNASDEARLRAQIQAILEREQQGK